MVALRLIGKNIQTLRKLGYFISVFHRTFFKEKGSLDCMHTPSLRASSVLLKTSYVGSVKIDAQVLDYSQSVE